MFCLNTILLICIASSSQALEITYYFYSISTFLQLCFHYNIQQVYFAFNLKQSLELAVLSTVYVPVCLCMSEYVCVCGVYGYTVLCSSNGNCFMACICRLGSRNWQLRTAHGVKLGTGNLWQLWLALAVQPVAVANALCENLCASALILIFSPLTRRTTTTTATTTTAFDCALLCSSSVCSSCLRWPFLAGFC